MSKFPPSTMSPPPSTSHQHNIQRHTLIFLLTSPELHAGNFCTSRTAVSQILWDCTLHPLYNPKYKILKSEQFYECSYWNRQKTNQLSSLSHGHLIDASLISQCTWHRLTCLARWIGRGSRIMRSNAIGTFLLEDRNVIKDVPAWHPPSTLLTAWPSPCN